MKVFKPWQNNQNDKVGSKTEITIVIKKRDRKENLKEFTKNFST